MQTMITPQLVKQLRDRTGVGMGKCKQALEDAAGDLEKAVDLLRKAGMASAVKKESRETKEGVIVVAENAQKIALAEINAETDFVVQNEKFTSFSQEVIQAALHAKSEDITDLMAHKAGSFTLEEKRVENVQSLGEHIKVSRLKLIDKQANTSYGIYSHMGGKIVCVVAISGASDCQDLARDIAMHCAADAPEYLTPEEIPQDVKAREEEISRSQLKGKPENIIDKIMAGKMEAFYKQVCLIHQGFVKEPSMQVKDYVAQEGKKLGKTLEVVSFVRWQVGQSA